MPDRAGSTVLGCVFYGPDEDGLLRLYSAHLGDSRAVLCRAGTALRLTEDHKPDREDEAKRIKAAGGNVLKEKDWPVARVITRNKEFSPQFGVIGLAVSRALGDLPFKDPLPLVSAQAEINEYTIDMEQDEFILMATDGIFDVLTDEQLIKFIREGHSADDVVALARKRESEDDCTVIIVRFGWRNPKNSKKEKSDKPAATGGNLPEEPVEEVGGGETTTEEAI